MKKHRFYLKLLLAFLSMAIIFAAGCIDIPGGLSSFAGPVVQTFEATPAITAAGEVTNLRWTTSSAQSAYIDNGVGAVAVNGTIAVSPNLTTVYTLTAKNVAGTAIARTNIIVRATQTAQPVNQASLLPVINLFQSDRPSISAGEYSVLRWNVRDSYKVVIDQIGLVDPAGEVRVYPAGTTTYTLTATNSDGYSTAGVTIAVLPLLNQETGTGLLTLNPVPVESGSLVKGYQHLDYSRRAEICMGDTSSNLASRAFLSFDISGIPENAIIQEAVLDLGQYTKSGDPTYAKSMWGNMGALEVYHVRYGGYEDLGATAYNQSSLRVQNGTFTDYPLSPWKVDVRNASDGTPVLQDLVQAGAPRFQLRLQFFTSTNWDGISDMLCFNNARLTIKYYLAAL